VKSYPQYAASAALCIANPETRSMRETIANRLEMIYVAEGPSLSYTTSSNAFQQPYRLLQNAPSSTVLLLGGPKEVIPPIRELEGIRYVGASEHYLDRLYQGYRCLKAVLSEGRGDMLVSSQQPESLVLGWMASQTFNLPWVVLCWDHPFGARYQFSALRRYIERPIRVLGYNAMLRAAAGVVTLIHPGMLAHAGLRVSNVHPLKNGVDMNRIRPLRRLKERDKNLIGALGRVSEDKGAFYILKAFARIRAHNPDARLIYIGEIDASQRGEITEQVDRLGLDGSVDITGRLAPDEALRRVAKCSIGLHAYRSRPDLYWNQVLKIGEYQGLGLVPIAMNYPGARDLIEDGRDGILVDPEAPEVMAKEVIALMQNAEMRHQIANRAMQTAEQRSWDKVGKQVYDYLQRVATDHRSAPANHQGASAAHHLEGVSTGEEAQ